MNTHKSKQAYEIACNYIPGGVNSPVRAFDSVDETPLFMKSGQGSHIFDIDDNEYIDYICSWGPLMLGHNSPVLNKDIMKTFDAGISYGLPTTSEIELAKIICEGYPGVDMVRMVNSGTEATMSAIRVARGYTKRDKIIKFEGCYHGHNDSLLVKAGSGALTFGSPTSPGVPEDIVKNTLVAVYNDIHSVKAILDANKGQIAAMILEPIAANMGLIEADESFLKELRELCTQEEIILIFDEVITGFRIAYGGAASFYSITPDMACFGKVIGGGLPVGAYAGKKAIMEMVSPCGPVYQAGTLSGNPLAMHLGILQLRYLRDHPEVYEKLEWNGKYLKEGIIQLLHKYHLPYQIHQTGSLLSLFFHDKKVENYHDVLHCDTEIFKKYFHSLLKQGILIAPSPYEVMFLSKAHTKEDIDTTLKAIENAFKDIAGY